MLELIAAVRVIQETGEVGEQLEAVAEHEAAGKHTLPSVLSAAQTDRRPIELVDIADVSGSGRREVAFVRKIRALLELHTADQFRDEEAGVGVAVRVRAGGRVQTATAAPILGPVRAGLVIIESIECR